MEILKWIEDWYAKQCDGDWEHSYGIKINTLDNPGWTIEIDLSDTNLESIVVPFSRYEKAENDWYDMSVKEGVYNAAGDPTKLEFLLKKFREFAESNSPS